MKIKSLGFASLQIEFDRVTLITDPILTQTATGKFPSSTADIVLLSGAQYMDQDSALEANELTKITPGERGKIVEIKTPGDYEAGGVIIRREIGAPFYILDEGAVRIVYIGTGSKELKPEQIEDMGDVDLLILPVGNGTMFPDYEKLEKIIQDVDPSYLIPICSKTDGLKGEYADLKSAEEFVKYFGYTHVREEKTLKVGGGGEAENKMMEVVLLK